MGRVGREEEKDIHGVLYKAAIPAGDLLPDRCRLLRRLRMGRRGRSYSHRALYADLTSDLALERHSRILRRIKIPTFTYLVSSIVCYSDHDREDHWRNPGYTVVRTERCPRETKEADCLERCHCWGFGQSTCSDSIGEIRENARALTEK